MTLTAAANAPAAAPVHPSNRLAATTAGGQAICVCWSRSLGDFLTIFIRT
jgi:hypothetical protein